MREDKHGHLVRRVVAPPAFPLIVRPLAADRAEHVAAENPRTETGYAPRRKIIVDARRAARASAVLALKRSRRENPFVQRHAAHAERVREILLRAGAVTVKGDAEAVDAKFGS